jgi:hypothetical protein
LETDNVFFELKAVAQNQSQEALCQGTSLDVPTGPPTEIGFSRCTFSAEAKAVT